MALRAAAPRRRQRALEVVGHELDHLDAGEVVGGCMARRSSLGIVSSLQCRPSAPPLRRRSRSPRPRRSSSSIAVRTPAARAVEQDALVARPRSRAPRRPPRSSSPRRRAARSRCAAPRAARRSRAAITSRVSPASRPSSGVGQRAGMTAQWPGKSSWSAGRKRSGSTDGSPVSSAAASAENGTLRRSRAPPRIATLVRMRKIQVLSDERPSKPVDPAHHRDPGLLHRPPRRPRGRHVGHRDADHRRAVAVDERGERLLVAAAQRGDESLASSSCAVGLGMARLLRLLFDREGVAVGVLEPGDPTVPELVGIPFSSVVTPS